MTFSQTRTAAAPALVARSVVAGPAQHTPELTGSVELTVLLRVREPAAGLPTVVDRMCEALYAQCITFEMLGVSSGAEATAGALSGLPSGRMVVADADDADAAWAAGFGAAHGRWVGYLDCTEGLEIDAYGFIEEVHRARESRPSAA